MSRRLLVLIYVATGATSLAYQLVWSRLLAREFGGTLLTTSAVVATYLLGLAIGSAWFAGVAERSPRPLRLYALLEIGVGLYALVSDRLIPTLVGRFHPADAGAGSVFLLTGLLLLPPTILMGGSFPAILAAARGDRREVPALFYGANTAGAVVGVLATGFVSIRWLGYGGSLLTAATLNLGVALLALVLSTRPPRIEDDSATPEPPPGRPPRPGTALAVLTLAGFAALVGEIAWTRALALTLGSSVYAFTLVLAAFLLGIGVGSLGYARRSPTGDPLSDLAHYQMRAAAAATMFAFLLIAAPWLLIETLRLSHGEPVVLLVGSFAIAFAATGYATTAMGASFPAGIAELLRTRSPARACGWAYALNTVGSVTGATLAAAWLIPTLGLALSMAVGISASLFAAALASGWRRRTTIAAIVGSLGACSVLPWWWQSEQELLISGVYGRAWSYAKTDDATRETAESRLPFPPRDRQPTGGEPGLVYARDGVHANVAVYRDQYGDLSLLLDGKADASTAIDGDMRTQLLLGHLPALLHAGQPRTALVIGLGSGVTVSALLRHPLREVDVVEIEPLVAHVASDHFAAANRNALADERVRLHLGDGRKWVEGRRNRYDIITSEPSNLWMSGVTHLFTAEFFVAAADALTPDGVLCQWMHLYQVSAEDVRTVLRGLAQTFPYAAMFLDGPDLLVVASRAPLGEPRPSPDAAADLRRVGVGSPADLGLLLAGDHPALVRFAGEGLRHTDDRPVLEFTAPVSLGRDHSAEIARQLLEASNP